MDIDGALNQCLKFTKFEGQRAPKQLFFKVTFLEYSLSKIFQFKYPVRLPYLTVVINDSLILPIKI